MTSIEMKFWSRTKSKCKIVHTQDAKKVVVL